MKYPLTPDGRYSVIKGRLWRATNPHLSDADRDKWVHELMRRSKGSDTIDKDKWSPPLLIHSQSLDDYADINNTPSSILEIYDDE